jgi:hypothetical protein
MSTQPNTRTSTLAEFWRFLLARKLYWMLPALLALVAVGALLVAAEGSAVAPFVYTLF